MKLYKIKRLKDELFSLGGHWPNFSPTGKTWSSLKALKSHLNLVKEKVYNYDEKCYNTKKASDVYKGCVVIVYNVVEEEQIDIKEFE